MNRSTSGLVLAVMSGIKVRAHRQVLANPFAWPALLGGGKAVPPVFAEFLPAVPAAVVPAPPAPVALQATAAGRELGLLYEATWQAVDADETWTITRDEDDSMDAEHAHRALVRAHGPPGVRMAPLLLRSAAAAHPTDCALMPCPRGALGNLRFVPLHRARPGRGEVQVTPQLSCAPPTSKQQGADWHDAPGAVCLSPASQIFLPDRAGDMCLPVRTASHSGTSAAC